MEKKLFDIFFNFFYNTVYESCQRQIRHAYNIVITVIYRNQYPSGIALSYCSGHLRSNFSHQRICNYNSYGACNQISIAAADNNRILSGGGIVGSGF